MADLKVGSRVRVVLGQRIEWGVQTIDSYDPFAADLSRVGAKLDRVDLLPSIQSVFKLGEKTNLRAGVARTVARPQLRELAPFSFTEYFGARFIVRELKNWVKENAGEGRETVLKTITYFENNLMRMNYHQYQKLGYPIGSGVTEAACKTVVKQRLSQSGMRWNIDNAQGMLVTRSLTSTDGRWEQFWEKYMQ